MLRFDGAKLHAVVHILVFGFLLLGYLEDSHNFFVWQNVIYGRHIFALWTLATLCVGEQSRVAARLAVSVAASGQNEGSPLRTKLIATVVTHGERLHCRFTIKY